MGMQGTMDYPNLTSFIKSEGRSLAKGPIALLLLGMMSKLKQHRTTTLNWGSNTSLYPPNHFLKLMRIL